MNRNLWICFLLSLLLLHPVFAETVQIKSYVNDYASVIDEQSKLEIEQIATHLQQAGIAEYAIVTIPSLEGKAIEDYSWSLAEGKLGNTEKDNGLLLLIAVDDHQYRFEVGRGLEAELNDAKIGRIGRTYLVPYFKNEEYSTGTLEASHAVESVLTADVNSSYYQSISSDDKTLSAAGIPLFPYGIMFMLFIVSIISTIIRALAQKKSNDTYFGAAMLAGALFGRGGRGGRGGGGMGGFGGGGFGSGGFGGGGASGRW